MNSNGVAVSDLSSWDSTEEDVHVPDTFDKQQYGFGMKHSEGMMDLSKVLSDDQQEFVPETGRNIDAKDDIDADRIYDSVENLITQKQEPGEELIETIESVKPLRYNPKEPTFDNYYSVEEEVLKKVNRSVSLPHTNNFELLSMAWKNTFQANHKSKSLHRDNILQPKYGHKFYNPSIPNDDNESDWDSPPLSEKNDASITNEKSSVSVVLDKSNSVFSLKQSNLITPDSTCYGTRHPDSSAEKLSSPSLHKGKDAPLVDGTFSVPKHHKDADNQKFSSLPSNGFKHPEQNSRASNYNR